MLPVLFIVSVHNRIQLPTGTIRLTVQAGKTCQRMHYILRRGRCLHACIDCSTVVSACVACRLVRVNVTEGISPATWTEILPQHEKDLLSGASALKVQGPMSLGPSWRFP